jgi:hypothetical protein
MKLLNEIQQKLKAPKGQRNNFGNYNYRSCEDILEAVKPLLGDGILLLTDEVVNIGTSNYIKAKAELISEDKAVSVCGWAREAVTQKGMGDAQITGSASSYARKYALNGLFCIDDTKDSDTDESHKQRQSPTKKTTANKTPKMNEHEVTAMKSVWLMVKSLKPESQSEDAFKKVIMAHLYKVMKHWPTTQGEQEEAINILDKEFRR